MNIYRAFGYYIESELDIPEFSKTGPNSIDFSIKRQNSVGSKHDPSRDFMVFHSMDRVELNWALIGYFEVLNRNLIIAAIRPDCDEGLVRFPLLGAVMALLLQLNGRLILHASSTERAGAAATFLGDKGAGKSTTAAAMITGGHALLSDDVVSVLPKAPPMIFPAYPNVKLAPATAESVGLAGEVRPKVVAPGLDKDQYIPSATFQTNPTPAKAFFVLERGLELSIKQCTALESFNYAMRFSYLRRFGSEVLKDGLGEQILSQCTEIARNSNFYRLTLPEDLKALPKAQEIVDGILTA
ncbi:hypothetical protein [Asticcacaulis sp. DW145]|uniref:hypothetical protein n=1 Tax=Asticcacaulis sp. DW145 TaxID=3095608 RepID=UPI0030D0686F